MALRDWLLIIMLGAIWGGSFLFNAVLIRELGPFWVSTFRVGVGALGCWAVFFALGKPLPRDPGLILRLGLLGLLAYALPFMLFPLSQAHLASGVAAILNALTPVTTVIIAHLFFGNKAGPMKFAGVAVGFAGAAILALPAISGGGQSELWAVGACLLATLCYALSLNLTRRFFHEIDPTTLATVALTGSTLGALPLALAIEGIPTIAHPETWAAIAGIGLLSTTFTFQVMYRILPRVGPTNFTATTYIAPVSAILLGTLLLGEVLLPTHFLGMAAIFLGLLIIDGRILRRFRGAVAG